MLSTNNSCLICKHPLEKWNRQFYCCDRNQRYCIVCRNNQCKQCGRIISKQFTIPRCKECLITSSSDNDMIYEPTCDKYYCAKCVVTRIMTRNNQGPNYIFTCGHPISANLVQDFIRGKFCMICGRSCSDSVDYDLLNGEKCCFSCFKWEKNKIEPFILNCLSCGEILKKMSEVGNFSDGFIVCKKCVNQSQISQQVLSKANQNKKIQQKRLQQQIKNIKLQDTTASSINDISIQSKNPTQTIEKQQSKADKHPNYSVRIISPASSLQPDQIGPIDSPVKKMRSPPKSPKVVHLTSLGTGEVKNSTSDKIFKTFSNSLDNKNQIKQVESVIQIQPVINQSKPKQLQPTVSIHSNQSYSSTQSPSASPTKKIEQKKSSQSDNLRKTILQNFPSEKQEQQQSHLPRSRMKKHLSMDTFVQKMKLTIQKQKKTLISCNECEYEISQDQSFQIQNAEKKMKKYCKLCYALLTNSQSLGFNVQQNLKPELDASRNKRGTSNQKYKQPTVLSNTFLNPYQANLQPTGINHMKLSAHNFDNYQKMTATVKVSDNKTLYREECVVCKKSGQSLIRTSDRGSLCFGCYYKPKQIV